MRCSETHSCPSLLSLNGESGRKGGGNDEHLSVNVVLTHAWRRLQQHLLQRKENYLSVSVTMRCSETHSCPSLLSLNGESGRKEGRSDEHLSANVVLTHAWRRFQQHLLK